MAQGKKFISPGAWFSMEYLADWNEFEDGEGSFLFYNPGKWTGNFRVSALKEESTMPGGMNHGKNAVKQEMNENPSAKLVKVGLLECAYSKEMFEEGDAYYTTHCWVTGIDNVSFQCSFTVAKGSKVDEAEAIIRSITIRNDGQKYPAEVIPVRLSEIFLINESYEWVSMLVKKQLKKDFQGLEEDLTNLQFMIDSGVIQLQKKEECLAMGITICTILTNEVEGIEWMTLIDGNREAPVLQNTKTGALIDPMKLSWSKIKAGESFQVAEAYGEALKNC